MTQIRGLIKALFSRQWLIPTLVVIVGMAGLARLGIWQLDRLAERRAANVQLRAVLEGPPLQLPIDSLPDDVSALENREVVVRGTYDLQRQGVLILQNWGGRSGAHIITPLQIAGSEQVVLVDRGWIPEAETADLAQFDQAGPVSVEGYVALTQTLSRQPDASPVRDGNEYYRVDVAAIAERLPYDLLPFYVVQSPVPGEENVLPFRQEREIDLSEGPHLSYAIQWFIFSMLLGIGYVVYVQRSLSG